MRASEEPEENLEKALGYVAEAASRGARIVCLQELFRTRYFPRTIDATFFALAEPIPGPTSQALAEAARSHGIVLVGSIFERRASGIYHNTAVVFDEEGNIAARYRKMHIPDDPSYYEKFYFTPGDTGFVCAETRSARIAPLVCWDQWFPEAARIAALRGAEIIVYPTAIGWLDEEKESEGDVQRAAWETIQRAHAIANGVFVAAVNRTGREGATEFWGGSFVADPFGTVIAEAPADAETVLIADCDLDRIEEIRNAWPFLRDRRVDAYGDVTQRFLDA